MTPAARERSQVRAPVLFVSAAAWILLVLEPGGMGLHAHHMATMPDASLDMLLASNPPASLALGWALMLAAMMAPAGDRAGAPCARPQLRPASGALHRAVRRRLCSHLDGCGRHANGACDGGSDVRSRIVRATGLAAVIALVWQFSPLKQRCLNRGHAHPQLAAFGRAADSARSVSG